MKEIVVSNVYKSYGAQKVIEDLSFSVEKGEKVALLAPSGCGKTTLLRLISGLEKPDEGEIFKKSEPAYLFQEPRLLPMFTVLENVAAVLNGKNRKEEAKKLLAQTGMEEHLSKYPDALSGGMAQRVVLARALATGREVFLLDEPYKGLDEESKRALVALTARCLQDRTVLLVTHDLEVAKELSTRTLTFERGMRIVSDEKTV